MISVDRKYIYAGPNLAYYDTVVIVVRKITATTNEIKFNNGMLFPNVPDTHLKKIKK